MLCSQMVLYPRDECTRIKSSRNRAGFLCKYI